MNTRAKAKGRTTTEKAENGFLKNLFKANEAEDEEITPSPKKEKAPAKEASPRKVNGYAFYLSSGSKRIFIDEDYLEELLELFPDEIYMQHAKSEAVRVKAVGNGEILTLSGNYILGKKSPEYFEFLQEEVPLDLSVTTFLTEAYAVDLTKMERKDFASRELIRMVKSEPGRLSIVGKEFLAEKDEPDVVIGNVTSASLYGEDFIILKTISGLEYALLVS